MSGFLIRDGLESDIPSCLALDHRASSDYVWQMNMQQTGGGWTVMLKPERLPRPVDIPYALDENRLRLALNGHCFLVANQRDSHIVTGYLTMRIDPVHHIALIQDLVVSQPFRRQHIGSRLLNVARQWARERKMLRLTAETPTKNYPGIQFCQSAGLVFCGFNDHYFLNQDIAVFFSQTLR